MILGSLGFVDSLNVCLTYLPWRFASPFGGNLHILGDHFFPVQQHVGNCALSKSQETDIPKLFGYLSESKSTINERSICLGEVIFFGPYPKPKSLKGSERYNVSKDIILENRSLDIYHTEFHLDIFLCVFDLSLLVKYIIVGYIMG